MKLLHLVKNTLRPKNTNLTFLLAASVLTAWSWSEIKGEKPSPEGKTESPTQVSSDANNNPKKQCPPYGCPLLPHDIYFDKKTHEALKELRELIQLKNEQQGTEQASTTSNIDSALDHLLSSGTHDEATLTLIGYKGGPMDEQINQDRAFVLSPFVLSNKYLYDPSDDKKVHPRLLGVFDGHGNSGEVISQHAIVNFPVLLSSKLLSLLENLSSSSYDLVNLQHKSFSDAVQSAIMDTFKELDSSAPSNAAKMGGCTASIVLQLGSKVYFANAGDSRSFLATYSPSSTPSVSIVYLTREDKPHLEEERRRIEATGGKVYIPPPSKAASSTSRVMYVDERSGHTHGLAMSRSIGDWDAGKWGVIPDPIVQVLDLNEILKRKDVVTCSRDSDVTDTAPKFEDGKTCDNDVTEGKMSQRNTDVHIFAVSATDGLLDFIPVQEIAESVATSLFVENSLHPLSACESLIHRAAMAWWQAKNGRYRDDIAIAISKIPV